MVKHDLDASIDYVLKETGQKFVYYVGHSQGTLIMFSKLAEDSKFASKIRQFHALAPVGTVGHIKGFLSWMAHKFYYESEVMLDILGRNQFLPDNPLFNMLLKEFCYQVSCFWHPWGQIIVFRNCLIILVRKYCLPFAVQIVIR